MSWQRGQVPSIGGIIGAGGGPLWTRYESETLIHTFQKVNATEGVYRTIQPDTAGLLRWWLCHAYTYTESGGVPSLDSDLYELTQDGSNIEIAISARPSGEVYARTWIPAHGGSTTATSLVGSVLVRRDGTAISSGEGAFVATDQLVVDATYNCVNDNAVGTLEGVLVLKLVATRKGAEWYWRFTPSVDLDVNTGYPAMLPCIGTRIAGRNYHFTCDLDDGSDRNFTGDNLETQFAAWDPENSPGWSIGLQVLDADNTLRVGKSGKRSVVWFTDDSITPGKLKHYCTPYFNTTLNAGEVYTGAGRLVAGKVTPSRVATWTPASNATKIGLWIKPSTSTAYSDAGTTLATIGGAVHQVNDLSGNNRHITQATAENQPTLQAGLFPLRVNLSAAGTTEDYMDAPQATPNCLVIWGCISRSATKGNNDVYFQDQATQLAIYNSGTTQGINFRDGGNTVRTVADLPDDFAFVWRTGANGRILTSDGGEVTAAMHANDWETLRVGENVAAGTVFGVAEFGLATDLSNSDMGSLLAYLQASYL